MSVGYMFSETDPKYVYRESACFFEYCRRYNPDKTYYVNVLTLDLIDKFIKFLDKEVKNFSIKKIKADAGVFFKITVSDEYNELSKYVITYLCGVFINQFSKLEGFIEDENPRKCDWAFLTKINNKKCMNTNHIIYAPRDKTKMLKKEWLEVLDNVELCNNAIFSKPFEVENTYRLVKTHKVGTSIPQTSVMTHIANCLEEMKENEQS